MWIFPQQRYEAFQMGTTLPVLCGVGETFFKTTAPAGQNFISAPRLTRGRW